jgi:hypothetical protein
MTRMKATLSTLALGLALGLAQAANAQSIEPNQTLMVQMKQLGMMDKDGMISKKDAMTVLEKKFDAMSKGKGKMTAAEFSAFAKAIGEGYIAP